MLTIKISTNFYLKGNQIWSYLTHVGNLEGDKIISFGKFSRTTTKQVYALARTLDLPIETQHKTTYFNKFEMGCGDFKNCYPYALSDRASSEVVKAMKGKKSIFLALLSIDPKSLKKKDQDEIIHYLSSQGKDINLEEWAKFSKSYATFENIKPFI